MMATLKVGIAGPERKHQLFAHDDADDLLEREGPKVWFSSTESFAKILSAGNRELLRTIIERKPHSLDELARMTGKAKSNLSRTLKTMATYGLITLERGERGRLTPRVAYDEVQLTIPLLAASAEEEAAHAIAVKEALS